MKVIKNISTIASRALILFGIFLLEQIATTPLPIAGMEGKSTISLWIDVGLTLFSLGLLFGSQLANGFLKT